VLLVRAEHLERQVAQEPLERAEQLVPELLVQVVRVVHLEHLVHYHQLLMEEARNAIIYN
jgi:hypothetical protein